jgi:glutathione S-transferase
VEDKMTKPRVSAFRWVPPFAQGLVRDLRVRWALEEMGLPYEERRIVPEDPRSETYLSLQPFGQVPSYEEDGLVLFESGAIVLHIAERSDKLMPSEVIPALNSYRLRCEARPAFQKALADRMARFAENSPATNK